MNIYTVTVTGRYKDNDGYFRDTLTIVASSEEEAKQLTKEVGESDDRVKYYNIYKVVQVDINKAGVASIGTDSDNTLAPVWHVEAHTELLPPHPHAGTWRSELKVLVTAASEEEAKVKAKMYLDAEFIYNEGDEELIVDSAFLYFGDEHNTNFSYWHLEGTW